MNPDNSTSFFPLPLSPHRSDTIPAMTTTPPTLRDLLQIPAYRKYFATNPRLTSHTRSEPWQVWIASLDPSSRTSLRWKGGKFHTYKEAYQVVGKALAARTPQGKHRYYDAVIVSRVQLFAPRHMLTPSLSALTAEHNLMIDTMEEELSWCGRCRRPSSFPWASRRHHALRSVPALTTDEPYRCFYCGIRKASMPRYTYPPVP